MVIFRHLTKEQELVHFDVIRERDEIQGADAITQRHRSQGGQEFKV
jgi:hypothetical protein